jgi:hypothetical protein
MTAGAEAPADSHSVYWTATSSAGLKRPVRNAHRWRLWFCSDYVRRLSGRLLAICHPVETSAPPQWWRWRESNPRPERFRFAGITTMEGIMGAAAGIQGLPEQGRKSASSRQGQQRRRGESNSSRRLRPACSSRHGRPRRVCCAPGSFPGTRCWPLQRDHHLVQVLGAVAGGKICRHGFRLLLRLTDLGDRSLQHLGEVGPPLRGSAPRPARPPAAAERRSQHAQHLIDTLAVHSLLQVLPDL